MSEEKNKQVLRKFLKEEYNFNGLELWRLSDITNSEGIVSGFRLLCSNFIGNGYISISKDKDEAIKLMRKMQPERDWSMFEIETYKDYTIILD